MTPEEEKKMEDIKAKKTEREVKHQESLAKMDENKKEILDLIAKVKSTAVKRKP